MGEGADGKRRYVSKVVHGTKSDAEKELTKLLGSKVDGHYVPPSKLTVDKYLDQWIADGLKGSGRTRESARWLLERYILPETGSKRLDRLEPLHVQTIVTAMTTRGLPPRTIRLSIAILKWALRQAIAWKKLTSNPADGVELPEKEQREMRVLDSAEISKLRAALLELAAEARARAGVAPKDWLRERNEAEAASWAQARALFDVMLTVGLRPGEAYALRWSDLDLEAGTLAIRRSLTWTIELDKDGARRRVPLFASPKAKSARTIPLGSALVAVLRSHRATQAELAMRLGPVYSRELDLVFANQAGRPLEQRNVAQRWLKAGLEKAGLNSTLRLYDLRHTSATHALSLGVNVKVVSERLGHKSAKMTLDVYSHVLPGMQEEATARIEGALLGG